MNQWPTHESEYEEIRKELEKLGASAGYALNPDAERLEKLSAS